MGYYLMLTLSGWPRKVDIKLINERPLHFSAPAAALSLDLASLCESNDAKCESEVVSITSVWGGRRNRSVSASVSPCWAQMAVFSNWSGPCVDRQRSALRFGASLLPRRMPGSDTGPARTSSTVSTVASWHQHSSGQGGSQAEPPTWKRRVRWR